MGNEDLPNGYFHSLVNTSLGRSIASFEDHRICVAELFHFCVYASWPAVVEMIKENYRREQDAMVKGILKAIKPLGKLLKMIIKKPDDIGYGKMRMHKTRTPRLFYGRERAYRIYNQEDLTVDQIIKAKENPKISTTPVDMIYVQSMDHGRLCFWLALKKISIVNLKKKQVFVEILLHNVKEPAIGDNSIILFFNKEVPNFVILLGFLTFRAEVLKFG